MIRLVDVSKTYWSRGVPKTVADRISVTFPNRGAVALIGRNGAGKSSLLRLIAGTLRPDDGRIETRGSVSWPVGFAGSFHGELTGAQNARFVARVHGVESGRLVEIVGETAELRPHFRQPFRTYSSGMKARLAFAISMAIDFDTYLIDEVTSVGDVAFRAKSEAMLNARLESRAAIVVSHNLPLLRRMCHAAVRLEDGQAEWFDSVDAAIDAHEAALLPG